MRNTTSTASKVRRERRRRKLFFLSAAVILLLAAALGMMTGIFDRTDPFQRQSAQKTSGGEKINDAFGQNTVVYDGKSYVYNDHLSNYLFLGIDTKGSIQGKRTPGQGGQSDAIFLVSYDRREETVVGLAIPRDTMTQIEVFTPDGESLGYQEDHLTVQYAYGDGKHKSCLLAKEAISRLLNGLPIDGYAAINLESLPKLAELVGGVEITVPDDDLAQEHPSFTKGNRVILDAGNTELFLRSRDTSVRQSAISRMNRQKIFLQAFAQSLASQQKEDASTVSGIYEKMKTEMVTNMSNDLFVDLALADREEGIETIPGEVSHEGWYDVYRVREKDLYEMIIGLFYWEVP